VIKANIDTIKVHGWGMGTDEINFWNLSNVGYLKFSEYAADKDFGEYAYLIVYDEINDMYFNFQGDCITSGCWVVGSIRTLFFNHAGDSTGYSRSTENLLTAIIKRYVDDNYVARKCYLIDAYLDVNNSISIDWSSGKLISDEFYWHGDGKCYLDKRVD
jgi:hypothetical protein